jgi:hypothetical protein
MNNNENTTLAEPAKQHRQPGTGLNSHDGYDILVHATRRFKQGTRYV